MRKVTIISLVVLSLSMFPASPSGMADMSASAATGAMSAVNTERNIQGGDSGYVIGPSNLINIKILGQSGLQETFRVDEGGFITHPLLGRVKISGMSVAQAENMIREELSGDYIRDPNVIIFVIEHSHFSVLGEVRKPGNYEILGRLSLLEGISIAGGFTPVANEKRIKVLRHDQGGEKTFFINLKDILDGRKPGVDIQAGDVIEVEKSFF